MKRFTILSVFFLCCLAVHAQRQSGEDVVRALTTGCESVPLPYHIVVGMKPSSEVLNHFTDTVYYNSKGLLTSDRIIHKNYKPAIYGDQFIFPVWRNYQCRTRFREPRYKPGQERGGYSNWVNVKFPRADDAKYFFIDAVSMAGANWTHMLITLDMKGRIVDKLEAGNFLESIAVRQATVDTNQIITIYALNVLNCKSIETPLDGQIAFRARRIDTRYTITPNGRFRKLDRVIYKRQPYAYDMNQYDSISGFRIVHVTDGNESIARTVQYRK